MTTSSCGACRHSARPSTRSMAAPCTFMATSQVPEPNPKTTSPAATAGVPSRTPTAATAIPAAAATAGADPRSHRQAQQDEPQHPWRDAQLGAHLRDPGCPAREQEAVAEEDDVDSVPRLAELYVTDQRRLRPGRPHQRQTWGSQGSRPPQDPIPQVCHACPTHPAARRVGDALSRQRCRGTLTADPETALKWPPRTPHWATPAGIPGRRAPGTGPEGQHRNHARRRAGLRLGPPHSRHRADTAAAQLPACLVSASRRAARLAAPWQPPPATRTSLDALSFRT